MVVDDEFVNRELMESLLTLFGYEAVLANSAQKALQLATTQPPDLILLDVRMPGMDGFEACAMFKADPSTAAIPIVLTTALKVDRDEERRASESGAVGILNRVMPAEEMMNYIATVLAASQGCAG
jgi:CheY-like chemotaxis protein